MTEYVVKNLTEDNYKGFEPVYEDFRTRAISDYNFELEPLAYDDFVEAVQKKLIECMILLEDGIPTAFLVYTTLISEAVELNIMHALNMENFLDRSKQLLRKFLEVTEEIREKKIVCYPMLGAQKSLIGEIARFGFKFVGIAVLRFMMSGTNSREILKMTQVKNRPACYKVVPWNEKYFNDAVNIIQESFENSADALFDPRFKTLEGTHDIITKITKDVYAEFLPEASSVLMCDNNPVGFCFMNLTGGQIVNIPIVGIKKEHQGRGLSKMMLKHSMDKILEWVENAERPITEINTTTETNNFQALKMYRNLGFKEDYSYPQSYLPIKK
ncbi:MAG: GNAT family N-acetyltransferase [Cyanobacteria bacterium SIG32]|nr:GNAT family N-acetyltransferase [Cyanobacteria bacterium SIG32]